MIHGCKPSEYFLGAILRGYDAEAERGEVTASGIWNRVVMECLGRRDGFDTMFQWDTREHAGSHRNRIADIAEAIQQGYVPGLRLEKNGKRREIVVKG
jgi:hypothetical protein